jgi:hypothetical protein
MAGEKYDSARPGMQSAEAKLKRQQLLDAFAALGVDMELPLFLYYTLSYWCMDGCMLNTEGYTIRRGTGARRPGPALCPRPLRRWWRW